MRSAPEPSPWTVAIYGLTALALAMGIGRFAFTPILPMMLDDAGLTIAQGGWLASANYVGYFAGALSAMRFAMRPDFAIRVGLLIIGLTTLAMGFAHGLIAWTLLRAAPGFTSAWVLVYVSTWTLERLTGSGRAVLSGTVYAGVGAGIIVAGVVCFALLRIGASSNQAWITLGICALLATLPLRRFGARKPEEERPVPVSTGSRARASLRTIPEFGRFVFCHGAYGFAYIVPATFLPVMAKQVVADPGVFGWAWPVFGAASALSTVLAAPLVSRIGARSVWIVANVVMAAGVLVPLALPGLPGIVLAALFVGGTFMVITMVALQEALRVGGIHGRALMGAMTSAFGLGQIIGPLLVSGLVKFSNGFSIALVVAAVPLLMAAGTLYAHRRVAVTGSDQPGPVTSR